MGTPRLQAKVTSSAEAGRELPLRPSPKQRFFNATKAHILGWGLGLTGIGENTRD